MVDAPFQTAALAQTLKSLSSGQKVPASTPPLVAAFQAQCTKYGRNAKGLLEAKAPMMLRKDQEPLLRAENGVIGRNLHILCHNWFVTHMKEGRGIGKDFSHEHAPTLYVEGDPSTGRIVALAARREGVFYNYLAKDARNLRMGRDQGWMRPVQPFGS